MKAIAGHPLLAAVAVSVALWSSPARAEASFDLHLYSDVNLGTDGTSPDPFRFGIGALDLFAAAQASPHLRLLAEEVLEFMDGRFDMELERLYVDVKLTDWLALRVGRTHTPLGYYLNAFHHALLLQLSTERPFVVGFEDQGAFIPAHFVGADLHGRTEVGKVAFDYTLGVGNGRGTQLTDILNNGQVDPQKLAKALVARLAILPLFLEDLEIGASAYLDRIPNSGGALGEELRERILGAHLAWMAARWLVIGELYFGQHTGLSSGQAYPFAGGFLQAGVPIGFVVPYARYEQARRSSEDPFFNLGGTLTRENLILGGVRFNLDEQAAVKLEYGRDLFLARNRWGAQLAFVF